LEHKVFIYYEHMYLRAASVLQKQFAIDTMVGINSNLVTLPDTMYQVDDVRPAPTSSSNCSSASPRDAIEIVSGLMADQISEKEYIVDDFDTKSKAFNSSKARYMGQTLEYNYKGMYVDYSDDRAVIRTLFQDLVHINRCISYSNYMLCLGTGCTDIRQMPLFNGPYSTFVGEI